MRNLAILLFLACAACTTQAQSPAKPAPAPAGQAGTLGEIRALIGAASCSDASQCRTLAVGARACGGPEGYLAYSTAQTDESALRALGERYKAERQAQIAASGEMSDCRFISDPGAVCSAGTCQLGTGSSGAAAR
jgi:hypothetical protein